MQIYDLVKLTENYKSHVKDEIGTILIEVDDEIETVLVEFHDSNEIEEIPKAILVVFWSKSIGNDFISILAKIQKRPSMYLGRHYLCCLQAYINGWIEAAAPESARSAIIIIDRFYDFVLHSHKGYHEQISGIQIIYLISFNDEHTALNKFFKLWDEFLLEDIL